MLEKVDRNKHRGIRVKDDLSHQDLEDIFSINDDAINNLSNKMNPISVSNKTR